MTAQNHSELKFEIGRVLYIDIVRYSTDHDAAIASLPHLLEVPAGLTVANLKFDPSWDPLRNDPRFQKLCSGGL